MRQRKVEVVLTALTALFVAFSLGFFTGRSTVPQTITTEVAQPSLARVESPSPTAAEAAASEPDTPEPQEQPEQTRADAVPEEESGQRLVNLNTAEVDELETLPGIGPVLAQRIVDYRQSYGPFASVEQLTDVSGIGEAKLAAIRELVTVED